MAENRRVRGFEQVGVLEDPVDRVDGDVGYLDDYVPWRWFCVGSGRHDEGTLFGFKSPGGDIVGCRGREEGFCVPEGGHCFGWAREVYGGGQVVSRLLRCTLSFGRDA